MHIILWSLRCEWESVDIFELFLDLSKVSPLGRGMWVGLVLAELGREYLGVPPTGDVRDECVLPMAFSGTLLLQEYDYVNLNLRKLYFTSTYLSVL
jgi:hypothetical protein